MPDHTQDFCNLSGVFRNPEPANLHKNMAAVEGTGVSSTLVTVRSQTQTISGSLIDRLVSADLLWLIRMRRIKHDLAMPEGFRRQPQFHSHEK
jgi:hypothetical protein